MHIKNVVLKLYYNKVKEISSYYSMNKITFTFNISMPTYVHLLFFMTMITNSLLYHAFALLNVEICMCGVLT